MSTLPAEGSDTASFTLAIDPDDPLAGRMGSKSARISSNPFTQWLQMPLSYADMVALDQHASDARQQEPLPEHLAALLATNQASQAAELLQQPSYPRRAAAQCASGSNGLPSAPGTATAQHLAQGASAGGFDATSDSPLASDGVCEAAAAAAAAELKQYRSVPNRIATASDLYGSGSHSAAKAAAQKRAPRRTLSGGMALLETIPSGTALTHPALSDLVCKLSNESGTPSSDSSGPSTPEGARALP